VHEAAGALAFLLSDGAAAINATAITMDGGLTACK
jgi:3-oxoacyl-[acyl-carrier protein] reductase